MSGSVPKQFLQVCGRPLLAWTLSNFEKAETVDRIVLVVPEENLALGSKDVVDKYGFRKVNKIVVGGSSRRESVLCGLEALPDSTTLVAIHDGARPVTSPADIDRVVIAAAEDGAAILAVQVSDTGKRVTQGHVGRTIDRNSLYLAQTPQVFRYEDILKAHREEQAKENRASVSEITDDSLLIEDSGHKVRVIEPTSLNLKVTTSQDLLIAEALLGRERDE